MLEVCDTCTSVAELDAADSAHVAEELSSESDIGQCTLTHHRQFLRII